MRSLAFVVTMLMACRGPAPQNARTPKAAQQDCSGPDCRVNASTCEPDPCGNVLTEKFNATQPVVCDNDPNCGGVQAQKRCDSPPCD